MDWTAVANLILAAVTQAPALIQEAEAAYTAVKGELSATDQASIDTALAQAKASDAEKTAGADDALTDASKH